MINSPYERLDDLPLSAVVAFATRCARRVWPLLSVLSEHSRSKIDRALTLAERYSKGDKTAGAAAGDARTAARAAVLGTAWPTRGTWLASEAAIDAAATAAYAWHTAAGNSKAPTKTTRAATRSAARAATAAAAAVGDAAGAAKAGMDAAVGVAKNDLERLISLDLGRPGVQGLPIDPSEAGPLGPLWPRGEPVWLREWRTSKESGPELNPDVIALDLTIVWDPAVLDERRYAKLVALLGDLVRAEGGIGIERLRSLGIGVPCGAGVRR